MNVLHYVYFGLLYGTLAYSLQRFRNAPVNLRLITVYLALHALVNSFAIYLRVFRGVRNNLFLYHVLTPLAYAIISLVFAASIRQRHVRTLILASIPVFALFCVGSALWLAGLEQNNTYPAGLQSLLVITWSLMLLKELFMAQEELTVSRLPMFWISMGLLVYQVGTMLVEASSNYFVVHARPLAKALYNTEYIFEYILLIMIDVGIYRGAAPGDS